jgi:hypothetical protein
MPIITDRNNSVYVNPNEEIRGQIEMANATTMSNSSMTGK